MKKSVFSFFLFFISVPIVHAAGPVDISIGAAIGTQNISGNVKYKGDTISLKDDLGLDKKQQTSFNLRIEHSLPILPNIYFRYLPSKFAGSKTNTTTIAYGDQTFDINTKIDTEFEIVRNDIGFFYNLPTGDTVDIDLGLNIRLLSFKGSLKGTVAGTTGISEEKSLSTPLPQLYGRVAFNPIDKLSILGELRYISYSGNSLTDYTFEAKYRPVTPLYIGVGYYSEALKIDTNDVVADISITVPYFMAGADF